MVGVAFICCTFVAKIKFHGVISSKNVYPGMYLTIIYVIIMWKSQSNTATH